MFDRDLINKLDMKSPSIWLATWFGFGFFKTAPGTMGTIGAIPIGMLILYIGGWPLLLAYIAIFTATGFHVAAKFDEMAGGHDHKAIVIDEVVGVWITMLAVPVLAVDTSTSFIYFIAAFLLFRFFDILKPWPISWADKKLSGAKGVMLDDILAGFFAFLIIYGARVAGLG